MLEDAGGADEVRRNDADVRSCLDRDSCGAGWERRGGPKGLLKPMIKRRSCVALCLTFEP